MPFKDKDKQLAYQREHYAKNKRRYLDWNSDRKARNRDLINELKAGKKCQRCPENDPACLVFHHRNPEEKTYEIANAISMGYSMESILEEVAKCDLVCWNCHIKIHKYEMGHGCDGSTRDF